MLLALDFGRNLGYCVFDGKTIKIHNCEILNNKSKGKKYNNFMVFVDKLIVQHQITKVVYEKVRRHLGADAAHAYGAFEGLAHLLCEKHSIPIDFVEVAQIKKYATGNGRADKNKMIEAAASKLGIVSKNDNEVDAVFIGLCFLDKEVTNG